MKKSPLATGESLKKIWNKASLIFFSILFIKGIVNGVKDTYLVPYLSEDLGASSQLISMKAKTLNNLKTQLLSSHFLGSMVFVASISCIMGNIMAKKVITFTGELNLLYFSIISECIRLTIYAFVKYVLLILIHFKDVFILLLFADLPHPTTLFFSMPLTSPHIPCPWQE